MGPSNLGFVCPAFICRRQHILVVYVSILCFGCRDPRDGIPQVLRNPDRHLPNLVLHLGWSCWLSPSEPGNNYRNIFHHLLAQTLCRLFSDVLIHHVSEREMADTLKSQGSRWREKPETQFWISFLIWISSLSPRILYKRRKSFAGKLSEGAFIGSEQPWMSWHGCENSAAVWSAGWWRWWETPFLTRCLDEGLLARWYKSKYGH